MALLEGGSLRRHACMPTPASTAISTTDSGRHTMATEHDDSHAPRRPNRLPRREPAEEAGQRPPARLLFLTHEPPLPLVSGARLRSYHLMRELARRGHPSCSDRP